MNTRIAIAMVVALGAVPAFAQVNPTTKTYTVLEVANASQGVVNNSGTVVGSTQRLGSTPRAFFWQSGTLAVIPMNGFSESVATFVGPNDVILGNAFPNDRSGLRGFSLNGGLLNWIPGLGGRHVTPLAMNTAGTIVGVATNSAGRQRAFSHSGGTTTDLGTLGGSVAQAFDINDNGTVVGFASNSQQRVRAFSYSGGSMTDLGILSGNGSSVAYGVNAAGTVVGFSDSTGGRRAVKWSGGQIEALASVFSMAYDINSHGSIVGSMVLAGQQQTSGFVWHNGTLVDLNTLIPAGSGWTILAARSINDNGAIVAQATKAGATQIVLLQPQP